MNTATATMPARTAYLEEPEAPVNARRGLVSRHPQQPRGPMNKVLQRTERAQPAAKGAASPEEQGDQRENDDQHQRRDAEKRAPVADRRRAPYGIDDFLQAGLHAEPAAQPDQRGGEQSPANDAVQPRGGGSAGRPGRWPPPRRRSTGPLPIHSGRTYARRASRADPTRRQSLVGSASAPRAALKHPGSGRGQ